MYFTAVTGFSAIEMTRFHGNTLMEKVSLNNRYHEEDQMKSLSITLALLFDT